MRPWVQSPAPTHPTKRLYTKEHKNKRASTTLETESWSVLLETMRLEVAREDQIVRGLTVKFNSLSFIPQQREKLRVRQSILAAE